MRVFFLSVLSLFSVAAYAKLDCDAGKFSQTYSPSVHQACTSMQKAIETVRQQHLENFAQALTQTQMINGELSSPVFQAPNSTSGSAPSAQPEPIIQYSPPVPTKEEQQEGTSAPTPQGTTPTHSTPWESKSANPSAEPKNPVIYY
ncbi:MAG: hypothetical protein QM752_03035 [Gammaproteobacteria bacterium]